MSSNKNLLRCPKCGFAVYSQSIARDCAKCNTKMELKIKVEKNER